MGCASEKMILVKLCAGELIWEDDRSHFPYEECLKQPGKGISWKTVIRMQMRKNRQLLKFIRWKWNSWKLDIIMS